MSPDPAKGPLSCDQARERFIDLVDGTLVDVAQAQVREHLAGCPSCDEEVSDLGGVTELFAGLAPVETPPDLFAGIAARIDAARAAQAWEEATARAPAAPTPLPRFSSPGAHPSSSASRHGAESQRLNPLFGGLLTAAAGFLAAAGLFALATLSDPGPPVPGHAREAETPLAEQAAPQAEPSTEAIALAATQAITEAAEAPAPVEVALDKPRVEPQVPEPVILDPAGSPSPEAHLARTEAQAASEAPATEDAPVESPLVQIEPEAAQERPIDDPPAQETAATEPQIEAPKPRTVVAADITREVEEIRGRRPQVDSGDPQGAAPDSENEPALATAPNERPALTTAERRALIEAFRAIESQTVPVGREGVAPPPAPEVDATRTGLVRLTVRASDVKAAQRELEAVLARHGHTQARIVDHEGAVDQPRSVALTAPPDQVRTLLRSFATATQFRPELPDQPDLSGFDAVFLVVEVQGE